MFPKKPQWKFFKKHFDLNNSKIQYIHKNIWNAATAILAGTLLYMRVLFKRKDAEQ